MSFLLYQVQRSVRLNTFSLLQPMQTAINLDQPCRTKLVGYPGRMMLRDVKRRTLIRKYWPERFRYQTLRKNMMLPESFKVCLFVFVDGRGKKTGLVSFLYL